MRHHLRKPASLFILTLLALLAVLLTTAHSGEKLSIPVLLAIALAAGLAMLTAGWPAAATSPAPALPFGPERQPAEPRDDQER